MSVLVTGGAGYIGSINVETLRARGEDVVVLDNLSRGHRAAVDASVPFYEGDVGDRQLVQRIAREHELEACIHFAAFAYVGESVENPELYWQNNVAQGIQLVDSLRECGVRKIVFSSTCATYGEPREIPISESHPQSPTNPYGWSKFSMERILESFDQAHGLQFVALRYFNAAGASEKLGEHHEVESHLIPNVLFSAQGRVSGVRILGDNYPTPDGTAVRDYIHVQDLASAHLLALNYLRQGGSSDYFNLGTGQGYSVQEIIKAAERVTGREIPARVEAPRQGDPSHLVAANQKAKSVLGWEPKHSEIEAILRSAWDWFEAHPKGYQ